MKVCISLTKQKCMSAVDNIMKRLLGTIFVLPMLFLLSCESEEKPQLGTLIIEHVTHDAISCQVKVVSGEVIDYGFYYSTTKDTAEKSGAPKEKGTYNGGTLNATISGLKANTTYYIRAYGMNSSGRTYTETLSVKTTSRAPEVGDNDYPTMN